LSPIRRLALTGNAGNDLVDRNGLTVLDLGSNGVPEVGDLIAIADRRASGRQGVVVEGPDLRVALDPTLGAWLAEELPRLVVERRLAELDVPVRQSVRWGDADGHRHAVRVGVDPADCDRETVDRLGQVEIGPQVLLGDAFRPEPVLEGATPLDEPGRGRDGRHDDQHRQRRRDG